MSASPLVSAVSTPCSYVSRPLLGPAPAPPSAIALLEPPPLSLLPLSPPHERELFAFAAQGSAAARYRQRLAEQAALRRAAEFGTLQTGDSDVEAPPTLSSRGSVSTDDSGHSASTAETSVAEEPPGVDSKDKAAQEAAEPSPPEGLSPAGALAFLRRPSRLALSSKKFLQARRSSATPPVEVLDAPKPSASPAVAPPMPARVAALAAPVISPETLALVTPPTPLVFRSAAVAALCLDVPALPRSNEAHPAVPVVPGALPDLFRSLAGGDSAPLEWPLSCSQVGAIRAARARKLGALLSCNAPPPPPASSEALPVSPSKRSFGWLRRGSFVATKARSASTTEAKGKSKPSALSPPTSSPFLAVPSPRHASAPQTPVIDEVAVTSALAQQDTVDEALEGLTNALGRLDWRWGGAAHALWGEGCGNRHVDDNDEGRERRRESGASTKSTASAPAELGSAGDGLTPPKATTDNSKLKRERSLNATTLESGGLLPPGAPPLQHWQGFNQAYASGSLDLDLPHDIPRGVPEFRTCPDASPLCPGPYHAPPPTWEAERLRTYWRLSVDDLDPERLCRVCDLVDGCAAYLGVPTKALSFFEVGGRVQQLTREGLQPFERERGATACGHAALNRNNGIVVLDTEGDWRFRYLTADNIRFYAGMPVLSSSGLPVGTLCFYDAAPWGAFTTEQRCKMRETARWIGNELEAHWRCLWERKVERMACSYRTIQAALEDVSWTSGSASLAKAPSTPGLSPGPALPIGPPSPPSGTHHGALAPALTTVHNPIDLETLAELGTLFTLEDTERLRRACETIAGIVDLDTVYLAAARLDEASAAEKPKAEPAIRSPLVSPTRAAPAPGTCTLLAQHGLPAVWPRFETTLHARAFTRSHEPYVLFQNACGKGVPTRPEDADLTLPRCASEKKARPTFAAGAIVPIATDVQLRSKTHVFGEGQDSSAPAAIGYVLVALARNPRRALGVEDLRYLQSVTHLFEAPLEKSMLAAQTAAELCAPPTPTPSSLAAPPHEKHARAGARGLLHGGAKRCGAVISSGSATASRAASAAAAAGAHKAAKAASAGSRVVQGGASAIAATVLKGVESTPLKARRGGGKPELVIDSGARPSMPPSLLSMHSGVSKSSGGSAPVQLKGKRSDGELNLSGQVRRKILGAKAAPGAGVTLGVRRFASNETHRTSSTTSSLCASAGVAAALAATAAAVPRAVLGEKAAPKARPTGLLGVPMPRRTRSYSHTGSIAEERAAPVKVVNNSTAAPTPPSCSPAPVFVMRVDGASAFECTPEFRIQRVGDAATTPLRPLPSPPLSPRSLRPTGDGKKRPPSPLAFRPMGALPGGTLAPPPARAGKGAASPRAPATSQAGGTLGVPLAAVAPVSPWTELLNMPAAPTATGLGIAL